jgi:ATP-dependent Clp protease protease subunit
MSDPSQKRPMAEKGMYLFMSQFTSDTVRPVIEWIIDENLNDKPKRNLNLIINSPGGDLHACFALIDTMKGSAIPIHTTGIGMIASCGFLTFISGEKGKRVLTPNTSILSHQFSWGTGGKQHELFAAVKEYELTTQRMIALYMSCIEGMTEKKITEFLLPAHDVWMSAAEAKKLKICDKVKDTY